jgi:tRNA dimethylallyltransferase
VKNPADDLDQKLPLVIVLGPTAVGKSEVAIRLAERMQGEIISADSRLLYRGMDIGTAKPSSADRMRVPHHLIDVADPDEIWSLAMVQDQARRAITGIHARRRLAFLVGGTGQYMRAITKGWDLPRVEPNLRLRGVLGTWAEQVGKDGLHQRLAVLDPAAAAEIDPRNLRRTIRALEVILLTGRPYSAQRGWGQSPYRVLQIGLHRPRAELYNRIDQRIDDMLAAGFVDEVKRLLDKGYSPKLPSLSAIGYAEIIAYLEGKMSLEEAIVLIRRSTRQFVRRQANWFKLSDPSIQWFCANDEPLEEIERTIRSFLGSLNTRKNDLT